MDDAVTQMTELCSRALAGAHVTSVGPTRSGRQVQIRVSYPWEKGSRTGYLSLHVSTVGGFRADSAINFKTLLLCILRLEWRCQGLSRRVDAVWTELEERGYENATLALRKEMASLMKKSMSETRDKRDQVESANCRSQIPIWLQSALFHGVSPDELHAMVDSAVVASVLKS